MAAFTTTTSLAERIPEIQQAVDYIFQNKSLGRALVTFRDVTNVAGKVVEFDRYTEVVASTGAGETAAPASHEMDLSQVQLTIAKRAVYVGLGDLAKKSMADPPSAIGVAMGMSMVKAIDTSIFGVITTTNYATSAGATNAALNITYCLNGLNLLEKNEVDTEIYCVVHPHQYKTVRAAFTPVAATTDTTTIKIANAVSDIIALSGFAGNAFGMNWFVSARVGSRTVDATASCYSGLIFSPKGIGYAYSSLGPTDGVEVIRGLESVDNILLAWADSAGVIYASGVCTLYSTSA